MWNKHNVALPSALLRYSPCRLHFPQAVLHLQPSSLTRHAKVLPPRRMKLLLFLLIGDKNV